MLHVLLFYLAVLTLALLLLGGVEASMGNRSVGLLSRIPPLEDSTAPSVSVVIAARDEERAIKRALQSVLAQEYTHLEVIVVNDRSTDRTGSILDRMQARDARLRVIHIVDLPDGWLGKNHALCRGAAEAKGEVLLFTDADVVMEPSTVARAVGYLTREAVDHLAIAPELMMPGALLDLFGGTFSVFFGQYAKPWKVRDPRSRRHVGIGAFNMIRASAYRAIGGHAPIAMRPDDDMKLGKLVKLHGFRQDVLFGRGMISVEWYSSLGEAVRGLTKNAFAGVEYSLPAVIGASLALLLFNVWPFVAVFVTAGATRLLNVIIVLLIVGLYADHARYAGSRPWLGIGFPVATLIFIYILWRSTLYTLWNRGIDWRGTHYPLEELRANRV